MKYNKSDIWENSAPNNFLFFWKHTDGGDKSNNTCLSQWYASPFTVKGIYYNCAEQYMMAEKARIFGDEVTWQQIMESYSPHIMKKLGRRVKNFDNDVWSKSCVKIVKKGSLAKFTQNHELKKYLLSTGDKILVEASPFDTIWGIGLSADDPRACMPREWRGENLLGFILMEVRDILRKPAEEASNDI